MFPVLCLVCSRFLGPCRALLDPAADRLDLRRFERLGAHRHARFLSDAGNTPVESAFRRLTRSNGPHRNSLRVQPDIRHLCLRSMTVVAGGLKDRLNHAREIDLRRRDLPAQTKRKKGYNGKSPEILHPNYHMASDNMTLWVVPERCTIQTLPSGWVVFE